MGNVWTKSAADAYAVIVHSGAQHARSLDCPEQLDRGLAEAGARSNRVSAKGHKESEGVMGNATGRKSSADTEVRQTSDVGTDRVLSASMLPRTCIAGANWNAKVVRKLLRLLQKRQLKFVKVWQSWWEGITQAQRQAVETLFAQRQMVQVAKDTDSVVWATLLGIQELWYLQNRSHRHFREAQDVATIQQTTVVEAPGSQD